MNGIERHQIGDTHPTDWRALRGVVLLVGSPTAFLLALSVRYALLEPACTSVAARLLMEASALIAVLAAAASAWAAWHRLRRSGERLTLREPRPVGEARSEEDRFVLVFALLTGALFLLSGVALWLPSLFLHPCGP